MERPLTPQQKRALAFLPPDGEWMDEAGRLTEALNSLAMWQPDLVRFEFKESGDRRWRLSKTGMKLRAAMEVPAAKKK
jgi:hypothetical protein